MSALDDFYHPSRFDLDIGDVDPDPGTVSFYLSVAGTHPRCILDIGAGTGRLALPLLGYGHFVICIDRSAPMIAALCERAAALPTHDRGRLTTLVARFGPHEGAPLADMAIAADDFLLHLTTAGELRGFFCDLRSWLRPGGVLVADVRPREPLDLLRESSAPWTLRTFGMAPKPTTPQSTHHTKDSLCCTFSWEEYDPASRTLLTNCQYQVVNSEGAVTQTYYRVLRQRIHTNSEIIRAANDAGFSLFSLSARNQSGIPPLTDIGGSFQFTLES